jgi:hypothetical protein
MKLLSIDINNLSDDALDTLVRDKDTNPLILDKIARIYINKMEILKLIIKNPSTTAETIAFLSKYGTVEIKGYIIEKAPAPSEKELKLTEEEREILLIEKEHRKEVKDRGLNLSLRIQRMSVSEKIQLALKGNKEVRTLLIRDPNKDVAISVIENPKITETEVELIAQSRNVPEEILRNISKNREWMKSYSIMNSLVNNPKTPIGVSLPLLSTLKNKELHYIEKSKGVPSVLRITAKRLLSQRSSKG